MKVTFLGHASLSIETLGKTIVVDPFISPNPQAGNIDIDDIEADYILITHAHQDHIVDVERIAQNTDAIIVSNFEIVSHYGEMGLSGHGMNHGGQYKGDFGMIKMVNAIHSSSFPDGKYGGNPAGFIIQNEEGCIYIAGDTCVTMDMKLIPSMGFKVDLAILPIGDTFTMGYQEASLAADLVECTRILGCHYDTFPPIKIDHEKAKIYFKDKGQELILLPIGDKITV